MNIEKETRFAKELARGRLEDAQPVNMEQEKYYKNVHTDTNDKKVKIMKKDRTRTAKNIAYTYIHKQIMKKMFK